MDTILAVIMMGLFILYIYFGYKAIGYLYWNKRPYLYTDSFNFYLRRIFIAIVIGWAAIPIAIIKAIFVH